MAILAIPAPTAHISLLLWELNIWQIYPSLKWLFHRFLLWLLIFLSYSERSYLVDQVLEELPPCQKAISQIPDLLWEFISGRPSVGRSIPPPKCQFHRLLLWLLIFPFSLWELILGRTGFGRSTPIQMAISQIPALTAHISFLLCELNIWQTRSWQIYPTLQMAVSLIPVLTAEGSLLLWQTQYVGKSTPHFKWQFHRFLLLLLIFISYSGSSTFGRCQGLAYLPLF